MQKYKNRQGDVYWFEQISDNLYTIRGELSYWRYGGLEGQPQVDYNNLGFVDPSGGPFLAVNDKIEGRTIKKIRVEGSEILFEVG